MRYLYLIKLNEEVKRSHAFRKPETVTLDDVCKANDNGYRWMNQEEAEQYQIEIPSSAGHFGRITKERTWEVPVKLEDGAIWCHWLMKWYAIWGYRLKGKHPSAKVMENVERIFRTNSGIPINHDVKFIWKENK